MHPIYDLRGFFLNLDVRIVDIVSRRLKKRRRMRTWNERLSSD